MICKADWMPSARSRGLYRQLFSGGGVNSKEILEMAVTDDDRNPFSIQFFDELEAMLRDVGLELNCSMVGYMDQDDCC